MPRTALRQPVTMSGDLTARIMFAGRSSSLSAQIVAWVRDALFAKKLKPGDFLGTEKDLAARFGASRIVARDALRTLEALGIVEIRMGKGGGARIAQGNPRLFAEALAVQLDLTGVTAAEIMDAQRAIETLGCRARRRERDPRRYRQVAPAAARRRRRRSAISTLFTRLSRDFHLAVAEASHNRVLVVQLISLEHVSWPRRNVTATPQARAAHPRHSHQAHRSDRAARRRRRARADGRPRQDDPRPARCRARHTHSRRHMPAV